MVLVLVKNRPLFRRNGRCLSVVCGLSRGLRGQNQPWWCLIKVTDRLTGDLSYQGRFVPIIFEIRYRQIGRGSVSFILKLRSLKLWFDEIFCCCYFIFFFQNVVIWNVVLMGLANPEDAFATPDGKAMFAQWKLATPDVPLMACVPMGLASVLMVCKIQKNFYVILFFV